MALPVRKAIFPVAGLGTRFLPATKAMPKEMLTVVDRPLIQIVVDEAREAGIEHFIFVTGRNKGVIEDHFDKQYELESTLRKRGKSMELDFLEQDLPNAGQTSFTRQQEPLGLGHAVWCARHLVGNEPFAVLLPDMIIQSATSCMKQMMDAYSELQAMNMVAVEEAPIEHLHRYGVVGASEWAGNRFIIDRMVEKPARGTAPSNLIISGRYILQPEIFDILGRQNPGTNGEIQITDAMIALSAEQTFHGVKFDGQTFDCGDKVGFLAANLAFALDREDIGPAFRIAMEQIVKERGGFVGWNNSTSLSDILAVLKAPVLSDSK